VNVEGMLLDKIREDLLLIFDDIYRFHGRKKLGWIGLF